MSLFKNPYHLFSKWKYPSHRFPRFRGLINKVAALIKTIYNAMFNRAIADSGEVADETITKQIIQFFVENELNDYVKFLWFAEGGYKVANPTDTLKRLSKGYSLDSIPNDWTQTVEANQPYLSGNIAPNEKQCISNLSEDRYCDIPSITFQTTDNWTLSIVLNWNGEINQLRSVPIGNRQANGLHLKSNSSTWVLRFNNRNTLESTIPLIGKNKLITVVHKGIDDKCYFYIDGVYKTVTDAIGETVTFSAILNAIVASPFQGKIHYVDILNTILTSEQIISESTLVNSIYPEVETVQIGSQHWATSNFDAVVTPMGTEIQEITLATNTEKITNIADREFSSDTGWWLKVLGWSIANGVAKLNHAGSGSSLYKPNFLTVGKYHKITFTIKNYVAGAFNITDGISVRFTPLMQNGTQTFYMKTNYPSIYFRSISFNNNLELDDISIIEIGWAGLDELATNVNNKAAAAWCYYNNAPALGAIYGKLYNWYAVKQIQDDINAWNAANPTNRFGYHVPITDELNTLVANLGETAVAGGKMKVAGITYWTTPNTGADNSSGFSVLGSGARLNTGSFDYINSSAIFWKAVEHSSTYGRFYRLKNNTAALDQTIYLKGYGISIRLIKD